MPRDQTNAGVGAGADAGLDGVKLSPDMLANIHGRLSILDRLAFASVFRKSCEALEAPWLILPGKTPGKATLFSLVDQRSFAVHAPEPALRGHAVIGSSHGWLATADGWGRMSLVNPVSGEQRALPAITTIPGLEEWYGVFAFQLKPFVRGPPYAGGREPCGSFTMKAEHMRGYLYRKVVLSDSPGGGGYGAAMLITGQQFGVAAFATAKEAAWRLAPSCDGVEDAIHHDGRFYSVTYLGAVEAWEYDADTGEFASKAVTPRLDNADGDPACHRKYLVAAPGGQLMVVLKDWKETTDERNSCRWTCSFKVQVLDGGQWKETDDIGDAALFIGANESLYVSTRVHPDLKAGHVYYTEDDLSYGGRSRCDKDRRVVRVFCLKDGTEGNVEGLGQHWSWPPPAWFTP
jgi:hypothetical protein